MHPNIQKLIEAGVLKVTDPNELPQDLQNKIAAMSNKDIDAITHMKANMDPELFKTHSQFIFP